MESAKLSCYAQGRIKNSFEKHPHARIPTHPDIKAFGDFKKGRYNIYREREFLKHEFLYPTPTTNKTADRQIDQIHSDVAYPFGV